jgi:hypothetical protein
MGRFTDFHEHLKLSAAAITQLAEDDCQARTDRFGVRQIELCHNPDGKVYCLLEGAGRGRHTPASRRTGSPRREEHQVDSLTRPGLTEQSRPGSQE